jgi:hypothetical protein
MVAVATVVDSEEAAFMAEVVVSTLVEAMADTTAVTGDSTVRAEQRAAALSDAQVDIPAWGAGSTAGEPGLAMEWHPMRESPTASGTASVASATRVLVLPTRRSWAEGTVAGAAGMEPGVIPVGAGAAGASASVGV